MFSLYKFIVFTLCLFNHLCSPICLRNSIGQCHAPCSRTPAFASFLPGYDGGEANGNYHDACWRLQAVLSWLPGLELPPVEAATDMSYLLKWDGLLEFTWNYDTEKQERFSYHERNKELQGFGHICEFFFFSFLQMAFYLHCWRLLFEVSCQIGFAV